MEMNRPDKRNALSAEMVRSLIACLERADHDQARVAVLRGSGSVFSAGADLAALEQLQTATFDDNLADSRLLAGLFRSMRKATFPLVASVHGHAIAGGAGLVAACDYAVAAEEAKLGFSEVRIGFIPAIVMTFVQRRIGGFAARDLLLSGRLINADEAVGFGLVNKVVPGDSLDETVLAWAEAVAFNTSRQAVAHTRQLMDDLWGRSLESALDIAAAENARARSSDDCKAGVRAFLRREDPPWVRKS